TASSTRSGGRDCRRAARGTARMPIVLYGIGSMIVADVAETCARLGLQIAAWVKNTDGETYESADHAIIRAEDVTSELTRFEFTVPLFTPFYRYRAVEE